VLTIHLDLTPNLTATELLIEESVNKQISLETRFEQESIQKFLDYANDWWSDFKSIKPQFKSRLVKIFAETDDREASIYKPVCTLIAPMIADRLLESPLHAARFVSLIPFQRIEAPGAEKVEVWHSMQAFLARVSTSSKV
jgi:centrosomal protein CEP76